MGEVVNFRVQATENIGFGKKYAEKAIAPGNLTQYFNPKTSIKLNIWKT